MWTKHRELEVCDEIQADFKTIDTPGLLDLRHKIWGDLYQTVFYVSPIERAFMQLKLVLIYKELQERASRS